MKGTEKYLLSRSIVASWGPLVDRYSLKNRLLGSESFDWERRRGCTSRTSMKKWRSKSRHRRESYVILCWDFRIKRGNFNQIGKIR